MGKQPLRPPTNPSLLLVYGGFFLLVACQLVGIGRSVVVLRRWWAHPELRPQSTAGIALRIGVPLAVNLVWAALMLIGLPLAVNLTEVAYQIPDLTYTLLATGVLALVWAIIRALWAFFALRKAGAVPAAKVLLPQG